MAKQVKTFILLLLFSIFLGLLPLVIYRNFSQEAYMYFCGFGTIMSLLIACTSCGQSSRIKTLEKSVAEIAEYNKENDNAKNH